jgi:putative transposase
MLVNYGQGSRLGAMSARRGSGVDMRTRWQDEAKAFAERDRSESDFVYLWVDGIHLKVRLEQEKLCLLVMAGVRMATVAKNSSP